MFEVEAGGDQAVGDRLVGRVVGNVHLVVGKQTSAVMDAEVRSRDHGQIIWIGGMEEGMEVGKAGAAGRKFGQTLFLAGKLIVNVFENDDQDAIKVAGRGSGCGACGFVLLACGRLGDLAARWIGLEGAGVMLCANAATESPNEKSDQGETLRPAQFYRRMSGRHRLNSLPFL